jgi:hypothetical protein
LGRFRFAAVAVAIGAFVIASGIVLRHGSHHLSAAAAERIELEKTMPGFGSAGEDLDAQSGYWNTRLTYPTGTFDSDWVRRAVAEDARVPRASLAAQGHLAGPGKSSADGGSVGTGSTSSAATASFASASSSPTAAPSAPFTSLGPKPLRMTGCSGCFNYTSTEGRINAIVVDPTTTTNGAITAYAASVGGGVWKTTTCCTDATTWFVTTDDPMISTTSIDALAIDPNDHNTVYAGTGDLNYGSFSMGSQGILKSTDGGAHWTVLGQDLFGAMYTEPSGNYPQYQAVGKVAVDPNDSHNVVAGTKKGLYFSYDGGQNWAGPCLTNTAATQRQDVTGLVLTDMGDTTRILTAVGTRNLPTPVQYDLDQNGANGVYTATMGASGCPAFTSIAGNANGFVYGSQVTGSPYTTGANMNAGSGDKYVNTTTGNQLGRIDLAVAPSDPNVIYAQVQSIAANNNSGCANAQGCQLGIWATTDGGGSWSYLAGSQGGALRNCSNGQGDYNQNWYDQGVAVDPNNPDRILVDTFDIWFATRTGSTLYDISCGYSYSGTSGPVHTDQHAIAYVPGSSSLVLFGNDGGMRYTTNADAVTVGTRPTYFDLNNGLNTIEFYSGDISANFASSAQPYANGGAQDNGSSTAIFSGSPTGPAQWQMGVGGDGFFARIDPVGNILFQGGNSGSLNRCTSGVAACTGPSQAGLWRSVTGGWTADTVSFILPYDIFKGTPGNPGGRTDTDCAATTCNHMIAGSNRVWENVTANTSTRTGWYIDSANLTKNNLGNRSYINQLAYSPATSSLAVVGTNDGNVQIGKNMGGGTANSATWVNVTDGNSVLPNRPILDVAFDPRSSNTAGAPAIAYAAVGGFNANTPSTPGHVYQVTCTVDCASFAWADKTGNLPDMPVDSIIANPKYPQQVFAGTDIGLYVTDDITAQTPVWYRLQNGMPNVMVWDMQIDRGNTTLSVWTRSRGAYTWPLPTSRLVLLDQTIAFAPIADHTFGDADFDVSATSSAGLPVTFAAAGPCTVSGTTVHVTGAGSCTVTASAAGNLDYKPADDVSQSFAIAKAAQTITFGSTDPHTFGDPDFQVTATATSGLPVSLAVASGPCTVDSATSPANVHISGGGTCVVTASQAGDGNWQAAPDETRSFEIAKAGQTIAFGELADHTYGDGDFPVSATASSGLPVTFSATGVCTVADGTVHITGAGDCTVTASQAGDDSWNPAPDVSRTFAVAQAQQTVSFDPIADRTYGDPDFALAATSTSGLDVTYSAAGTCSVTGATVHIVGAGSCSITAVQAGDANYLPAADVTRTFTIAQASQSITFDAIPSHTMGDADFAVHPTASSGLVVYLVASGPCTVDSATSPATVHITGAGSCTITASQPGDVNRLAAPSVARTFAIAKGSQTITFPPIANRVFGGPFTVAATSSAGLPVTLSTKSAACTVSGNTVTPVDNGICTIVASQPGNADWNAAASVTRSFVIANTVFGFANGDGLRPSTGGKLDFDVDGRFLFGPRGNLDYEASRGIFGRSTPPVRFQSKSITAFGLQPDGHSAWFAGVGKDGRSFVAYVADFSPRPRKNADNDQAKLWIDGVLQTGDGSLDSGNVKLGR